MLTIKGKTVEGRLVVGGVFDFYATHGVPLEVALDALHAANMVVDWPQWLTDAVASGLAPKRARRIANDAIVDVLGPATAEEIRVRFERLLDDNHRGS